MATFNGADYLNEQIDSIIKQRDVNVTIYISDDLSTDNTRNIISSYINFKNCYLIDNSTKHGSAGKNFYHLISNVNFDDYDYVSFADQDDIWCENKLINSINLINTTHDCVGVSSSFIAFWPNGRNIFVNKAGKPRDFDYFFEAAGPGCTYLLRPSFADNFKNFLISNKDIYSNIFSHDWLIYAYARHHGYSWLISPNPSIYYRQHSGNETGVNFGLKAFFKRLHKLNTGEYLTQVYEIANIVGYRNKLDYFFSSRANSNLIFYLNFRKMRRKLRDAFFLAFVFFFKIIR